MPPVGVFLQLGWNPWTTFSRPVQISVRMPRCNSIYCIRMGNTEKQAADLSHRLYVWMGTYRVLQLVILRVTCCGRVLDPKKAHSLRTTYALHMVCTYKLSEGSHSVAYYRLHANCRGTYTYVDSVEPGGFMDGPGCVFRRRFIARQ